MGGGGRQGEGTTAELKLREKGHILGGGVACAEAWAKETGPVGCRWAMGRTSSGWVDKSQTTGSWHPQKHLQFSNSGFMLQDFCLRERGAVSPSLL